MMDFKHVNTKKGKVNSSVLEDKHVKCALETFFSVNILLLLRFFKHIACEDSDMYNWIWNNTLKYCILSPGKQTKYHRATNLCAVSPQLSQSDERIGFKSNLAKLTYMLVRASVFLPSRLPLCLVNMQICHQGKKKKHF